ncbi:MAG: WD40/YVTN/BNR-like repeat-containing protein [Thermomicrobiales bacterium]
MLLHTHSLHRLAPICGMALLVSYTLACSPAPTVIPVSPTATPTAPMPRATTTPLAATATTAPTPGTIDLSQARPATVHTLSAPSSDGPPPNLTDVSFVTAQTGFGVTATGGIYRSTDGGATWQIRFRRGGARFYRVVFSDAHSGMALGSSDCLTLYNNCEGPTIIARTRDGGDTWEVIEPKGQTLEPDTLRSLPGLTVVAISPQVSYAIHDPDQNFPPFNILLTTDDGGSHWRTITLPQDTFATGGISFLDPLHGYITAWTRGTNLQQILATADGGETWVLHYQSSAFSIRSLQFLDMQHGFAGGGVGGKESAGQDFYATDDGGVSWHLIYHHEQSVYGHGITKLHFSSETNGWAALGGCNSMGQNGPCGGALWHTSDGGRTWSTPPGDSTLGDVVRFSSVGETAWVAPGNEFVRDGMSILYRTTDGGRSWKPFWRPEALSILRMQFISASIGWMDTNVGFFQTRDGGIHWAPYTFAGPVTARDHPIFVSESVIIAVHSWDLEHYRATQQSVELFRSEDGGQTWQAVPLPQPQAYANRGAITFAGSYEGWFALPLDCRPAACSTAILATTDGGRSWQQRSLVQDVRYPTLAFGDGQHGVMIGQHEYGGQRRVLLTNDGGRSWSEQPLPPPFVRISSTESTSFSIGQPSAFGANETWLWGQYSHSVGGRYDGYSLLIRSDDGGQHWTIFRFDGVGPGQVQFFTASDGLGSGGNTLYITHNGGQEWQQVWPEITT